MMLAVKIISVLCLAAFVFFLLKGAVGFIKTKTFVPDVALNNTTKTCIIICARNEEKNIEKCLRSIFEQDFDKNLLEIILVNDGSTDDTLLIAQKCFADYNGEFQIINNKENLGKKKSITSAIELCNSELIITRDADTYTNSRNWLKTIVSFYEQNQNEFIIAPLQIENRNGVLQQLQSFENAALAILTGGYAFYKKAFLCNGANLAFTKKIFTKVNGYKSHLQLNSGDDVFLLEDVKKLNPNSVAYLKNNEATVITYPLTNLKKLMAQKVRWASKADKNPNQFNQVLAILVFLVHTFGLFYLIKPIFAQHIPYFGIIFVFLRVFIDFLLLFLASRYFNKPVKWAWFLPLTFVYSFYVIVTAFLSLVKQNRN